jgi:choline dehydrogenase-like flavoprotein
VTIHQGEFPREAGEHVTVCIVGTGAAGITLACELDGCGFRVLVLEAGQMKPLPRIQDDYRGEATRPHPPPDEYRRVAFGGTTSIWGGRCVPFDPIDFEPRDHVAQSGWPIAYDDVARHYPRALEYCDAGAFDFRASTSIADAAPMIPGVEGGGLLDLDLIERYSLPTDFGARYAGRLAASANVTVVIGARCVGLSPAAGASRIDGVEIVLRSGERCTIRPRVVVLAAGGIESTRLLLASDPGGTGLGNRHDLLGRFYACHLETAVGRLRPLATRPAFQFERTRDGVYCRRKIQFSAEAQRSHRLLNTAFRLHFPEYSDASHGSSVMSAIFLAKSALIGEYRSILQQNAEFAVMSPNYRHWLNVLRGMPEMTRFGFSWLFRRQLATRKLPYTLVANADGSYPLEFNCEQTPLESSRISLISATDRHGMPRVHVDWRRSAEDLEAVLRAFRLLRERLSASGVCRLEFDEADLQLRVARSSPLGGHHIGTTRMAATPRRGVVDGNCALFDFPNLYVASSAVFPTGSHANPTLTIVALALRMARHLRAVAAQPG